MKVIGYRPYRLTDDTTGEVREGVTIFVTEVLEEGQGTGSSAAKYSVKKRVLDQFAYSPKIGDEIYLGMDQYKRVNFIQALEPAKK